MADNKEKLFTQFPPVSYDTWRAKVDADLKGVPFEKKLVWRTNEGFTVQPMYQRGDIADLKTTDSLPGEFPFVRGTRTDNNWLTRQEIIPVDAAEANKVALDVLGKGVNSLGFTIKEVSEENVAAMLAGIDLEKVEVNFTTCPRKAAELAKVLVEYLKKNGLEKTFRGSIDYNPFKRAFRHGTEVDAAAIKSEGVAMLALVKDVPGLRCLAVDSVLFNNSGAYIFQELGYALAWGAEWLTLLTEAGVSADEVASRIKFNMGISSNYFMELAKFRAARMMWAQIVKQYAPAGDDACKMMAHAVTSQFNQTIYDAHVNLLRSQTEAMSAALAGVDSITVTPFDMPYKTPDEFSERIARNQQLLLKEESHLDKVVDPAGGSYYVETLTVSIAQEAWKLFLDVEEKGGFVACVNAGEIQAAVNASSVKRHQDMARRKEILLGTNQFPNFNEFAAEKIEKTGCCAEGKHESACGCAAEGVAEKALRSERQASPRHSCSPSATSPCVWPVLSSRRTSSDVQAMRFLTTSDSNPFRKASTLQWKKVPILWFSARQTMSMPSSPRKRSSFLPDALNLLLPALPPAPTTSRLSASRISSTCAAMCLKHFRNSTVVSSKSKNHETRFQKH